MRCAGLESFEELTKILKLAYRFAERFSSTFGANPE
jgi:hypothetical protein